MESGILPAVHAAVWPPLSRTKQGYKRQRLTYAPVKPKSDAVA